MEKFVTPKIKICGIKREAEAEYLNEAGADYGGVVFYEKSRRNVSIKEAESIVRRLYPGIKKVAVTVSLDENLAKTISQAGFDILQVHGEFRPEILKAGIPLWRAVNITEKKQLQEILIKESAWGDAIAGFVADGKGYGGGEPFDWEGLKSTVGKLKAESGKMLILAGGLHAGNVERGIRYFFPDVVDVSSGVEEENGKSREKILEFVKKVRETKQIQSF